MGPALLALALCSAAQTPAPDTHAHDAEAPAATNFVVGGRVGYAFRPQVDERAHGAAAALFVDAPVWGPLGARLEGTLHAWGGSGAVPEPLLLTGASLSLLYSFDETTTVALLGLGPFVGAGLDGAHGYAAEPVAGALLSLTLRLPLTDAAAVEAHIGVPFVLATTSGLALDDPPRGPPRSFPVLVTASLGVSLAPIEVVQALVAGENPLWPRL